jgi:hypothetical protein
VVHLGKVRIGAFVLGVDVRQNALRHLSNRGALLLVTDDLVLDLGDRFLELAQKRADLARLGEILGDVRPPSLDAAAMAVGIELAACQLDDAIEVGHRLAHERGFACGRFGSHDDAVGPPQRLREGLGLGGDLRERHRRGLDRLGTLLADLLERLLRLEMTQVASFPAKKGDDLFRMRDSPLRLVDPPGNQGALCLEQLQLRSKRPDLRLVRLLSCQEARPEGVS